MGCELMTRGVVERYVPKHSAGLDMVLIVEDEGVSRRALATLLAANGYTADAVESAEEALEHVAREGAPKYALIDLDLPGMSGAELIQQMSQIPKEHKSLKYVLITAVDRERLDPFLRRFGVTHLRKPLNFNDLLSVLQSTEVQ